MLKMLWTGEYDEYWLNRFTEIIDVKRAGFNIHNIARHYMSEDEVIEQLQECDVFFNGYDPLTKKVLENCPMLKLVLSVRDGPEENIDLKACEEYGIPVLNSAGRCTISVAELTMHLIANMARPIIEISNEVRKGNWTKENNQVLRNIVETSSYELYRKTLGIIGLGRNGKHLAKIAEGYGMSIIAYDPYVDKESAKELDIRLVDLDELAKESDYISILARVTPENVGLFGKKQFALMKNTACIVNTARPQLMDYLALKEALTNNQIRMAAIDVFKPEPIGLDDDIFSISSDKLILTSHIAGYCRERTYHQYEIGFDNLIRYLDGEQIQNNCTKNVQTMENFKTRGGSLFGVNKK